MVSMPNTIEPAPSPTSGATDFVPAFFPSFAASLLININGYSWKGHDPFGGLTESKGTEASFHHVQYNPLTYSPVHVQKQAGLKEADMITKLPGQPDVNFDQYSGYVTIDPNAGRALFYYFTESNNPSTKPLVLWLNGGPGCSSIGGGAMMELGPFRVNPDGKTLWYNENAWNNVANVMYLESPAGVGFSYSNRSSDYNTGDKQTADDSYTFLVNWLDRFPEYKTRDFYIAGESYAGHYVPQLAELILRNNKITNQTVINLKGIAIGNAQVDQEYEYKGGYDFAWTHALISDEIYSGILQHCNFSMENNTEDCAHFESQASVAFGDLYGYNIYAPLCSNSSSTSSVSGFDPCSQNYINGYLNTPEVQKAFHANVTGVPGPWENCSPNIQSWQDRAFTVLPVIKQLMASGISVWMYSGDIDGAVPVTVTRYALAKIGAPVNTPWYSWYLKGEVGGYAIGYENITFVTVRGAGHFVPSYQPERALVLFSSFIAGKLPPSAI